MKKIFFLVFVCLSFLCCKIDVKTPQKDPPAQTESPAEDPAPDPSPAPTPTPNPEPDPEPQVRYELKTGPQINAILWSLCGDDVIGFFPSSERPPEGKTVYYLDIEEKNVMVWESDNWTKIYYYAEGVTTGDKNGKLVLNEDSSHFFEGCRRMENIDVSKFDTSNVVNMSQMFSNCTCLTNLDLSHFNTSKVTDMSAMFKSCEGLIELDLSSFNTSKVENMHLLFGYCYRLKMPILSSFNTSKVKNMNGMFYICGSINNLDLSNFDTTNVENMSGMFSGCVGLKTLDLSSFDTSKVQNMSIMFSYCRELITITVSEKFDTSLLPPDENPEFGDCMFSGCIKLVGGNGTVYDSNHCDNTYAHIDGGTSNPGFFTEVRYELKNGLAINEMVHGKAFLPSPVPPSDDISDINYLDIEEKNVPVWNDSNTNTTYYYAKGVTTPGAVGRLMMNEDSSSMFYGQVNIENINIQVFDSRNVTNMKNMFGICNKLESVDVSHFNTSKVTNMERMFDNCYFLPVLDVSNFDTSKVENMEAMFNCCAASILDVSKFNTSKVTTMAMMFDYAAVEKLDLSNWDTSKVKDMYRIFECCCNLTTIIVSDNLFTSALEEGNDFAMFSGCSKLVGGSGTRYNENYTDSTYARIDGGPQSSTPGYFTLKQSTD